MAELAESIWGRAEVSSAFDALNDALKNDLSEDEWKRVLTAEEYMRCYTVLYNSVADRSTTMGALYDAHQQILSNALREHVLPKLEGRKGIELLGAFVQQWNTYNHLIKWMKMMFMFVEHNHVKSCNLRSLREVAVSCFHDIVYLAVKDEINAAHRQLLTEPQHGSELELLPSVLVELGVEGNVSA